LKDYLLFIDTETSGIPLRWDRNYTDSANWPHVIQVAWIIYDLQANEVKRCSRYIYQPDVKISAESFKVHGISQTYLREHGERSKLVLRKLAHDIKKYKPLIVGHFLELDIQVLSAAFYRAHLPIPFGESRFFCTMLKSKKYVHNPSVTYMRLNQLHEHLFAIASPDAHEAEHDAALTAACYFALQDKQEISIVDFREQQAQLSQKFNFQDIQVL